MRPFNPLLFEFPTSYKGLKMNTDFRIGIMMNNVFNNPDLEDDQKKEEALNLLFDNNIPEDILLAWEALIWFMNIGNLKCINKLDEPLIKSESESNEDEDEDENVDDKDYSSSDDDLIDFEFDGSRIWSGFLRTFGVDLSVEKLHYWRFLLMLSDLDKDCSYSRVAEIRSMNLQGMQPRERIQYRKLKKLYAIPIEISDEDKAYMESIGLDEDDLEMFMQY